MVRYPAQLLCRIRRWLSRNPSDLSVKSHVALFPEPNGSRNNAGDSWATADDAADVAAARENAFLAVSTHKGAAGDAEYAQSGAKTAENAVVLDCCGYGQTASGNYLLPDGCTAGSATA